MMKYRLLFLGRFFFVAIAASLLTLPAFSAPADKECEIWRDEQGIPHLHAAEDLTGIRCLGYVHGRDRSWQMDYFRKAVQGRRAEFLGRSYLRQDIFLRLLDLNSKAKALLEGLPSRDREIFTVYAEGVNRGMLEAQRSHKKIGTHEFEEYSYPLDLTAEPWEAKDSLGLMLLQSFDQTRRSFQIQLDEKKWLEANPKAEEELSSDGVPWDTSILKKGEYPIRAEGNPKPVSRPIAVPEIKPSHSSRFDWQENLKKELLALFPSSEGVGSNNWVVAPSRSASGVSWMANDPHLQLTRPPFWHWIHLAAGGDLDVIGASFPGIPLVVSGSNRHVSWGVTNSYLTTARISLVSEDELMQATSSRPVIWVKFWKFKLPFFFKEIRKTPGGFPILPLPAAPGKALVLRWSGLDLEPGDLMGLYDLMKAKTVTEADRAFAKVRVPSWNFVFADDAGGIGYRAVGRIPRFEEVPPFGIPDEKLVQVEKSPAFLNPLNGDEMPHILNPTRGYVATANNRQWPGDSKWSAGRSQITGFRAFRIEELLNQTPRHDLASLQKTQCDVQAVDARFILPEMIRALERADHLSSEEAKALHVLKAWDFQASLECEGCALFRRWIDRLLVDQDLNTNALYRKLSADRDSVEVHDWVLKEFRLALKDLGVHWAKKWKDIHLNEFAPLAGGKGPGHPLSTPGDDHSVNPGSSDWDGKIFWHTAGASQRLIVEMSRPPKVYSVLAGANEDLPGVPLDGPDSEWVRWAHCQLQLRNFPVDWAQVKGQKGSYSTVKFF